MLKFDALPPLILMEPEDDITSPVNERQSNNQTQTTSVICCTDGTLHQKLLL